MHYETLYLSGKRVHAFHRKTKGNHMVLSGGFLFLAISYYSYIHLEEFKVHPYLKGIF